MATYTIQASLDKTSAPDTSGTLDPSSSDNKITMTISVKNTDGTSAGVQQLKLQVSPLAPTLFDANNQPMQVGGDGLYLIATDTDGTYKVQFMSGQMTYADILIFSATDGESVTGPYTIFFGSYDKASPSVPGPILSLNDDTLPIPSYSPYFIVNFVRFTAEEGQKCVTLLNGNAFYMDDYATAVNEGMKVPSAHLDATGGENKLSYFVENMAGNSQISPAISFKAQGTPYMHPDPGAENRVRTKRPYLPNYVYVINNTTKTPVIVSLDFSTTEGDPDYLKLGDVVVFTTYINGWLEGSNDPKISVFDVEGTVSAASVSKKTVTALIPANKIAGFGANLAGTPGELEIDYTVNPDGSNPSRPKKWMTGLIDTTGL
ncbi:hypothetical protein [Phyllobacterium phragmitis]